MNSWMNLTLYDTMQFKKMSFSGKPVVSRFNASAVERAECLQYVQNRCTQSLACNEFFSWDGSFEEVSFGLRIPLKLFRHVAKKPSSTILASQYILDKEGHVEEIISDLDYFFIRSDHETLSSYEQAFLMLKSKHVVVEKDSKLETFLREKGVECVHWKRSEWPEYNAIEEVYGDRCAERTRVHLMNHIDEGIYILKRIGASELAQRAYALHPIIQGELEFKQFWDCEMTENKFGHWDGRVLLLAAEYRNIANAYLSHCASSETFALSPISEVNQMLIADKIQNRKDFDRYHNGTHPKSDRLIEYFGQWLRRLQISEEANKEMVSELYARVGGTHKFC